MMLSSAFYRLKSITQANGQSWDFTSLSTVVMISGEVTCKLLICCHGLDTNSEPSDQTLNFLTSLVAESSGITLTKSYV